VKLSSIFKFKEGKKAEIQTAQWRKSFYKAFTKMFMKYPLKVSPEEL